MGISKSIYESYNDIENIISEKLSMEKLFPNQDRLYDLHLRVLSHFVIQSIVQRVCFTDDNCKKEMRIIGDKVGMEISIGSDCVFTCIDNIINVIKRKMIDPNDSYSIDFGLNKNKEITKTYFLLGLIQYVKEKLSLIDMVDVNSIDEFKFIPAYSRYINKKISANDAAKEFGCGRTKFFQLIDRYHLPKRNELYKEEENNVKDIDDIQQQDINNGNGQIDEIIVDGELYRTQTKLVREACKNPNIIAPTVTYIIKSAIHSISKSFYNKNTLQRDLSSNVNGKTKTTVYKVSSFEPIIKDQLNIEDFLTLEKEFPNVRRGNVHRDLLEKKINLQEARNLLSNSNKDITNIKEVTNKSRMKEVAPIMNNIDTHIHSITVVEKIEEPQYIEQIKTGLFGKKVTKIANGIKYILVLSNKDKILVDENKFNTIEIGAEYIA
ncbi:MAG: hypothetical protein ACI3T9_03210 [Romboutsia timonensis]